MRQDNIEVLPVDPAPHSARGDTGIGMPSESGRLRQDQYEKVKLLLRSLLAVLGENPYCEGLRRTPERMARLYAEFLSGYEVDVRRLAQEAVFEAPCEEMITVRDIHFSSLCQCHLLPFYGHVHVAYVPRERVMAVSAIPRLVRAHAHRLQTQDQLGEQIANRLDAALQPRGVAVVVEATHSCAAMRGERGQDSYVRTEAMRGEFQEDEAFRSEFLQQLQGGSVL